MNETTFEPAWEFFIRDLLSWLSINFLSPDAFIQGAVILGLYISGKLLTRLIMGKIRPPEEEENGSRWVPAVVSQNLKETLFFSFFSRFLFGQYLFWLSLLIFHHHYPPYLHSKDHQQLL